MTSAPRPIDSRTAAVSTMPMDAARQSAAPAAPAPAEGPPDLGGAGLGALWRSFGGPASALPEDARYRVSGILGVGATAQVWEVEDRNLARTVAVKVLVGGSGPQGVQHFLSEARLMALLDHPNVLPVHEASFTSGGQPYFAMKRIAGTTLGEALLARAQGRASPRVVDHAAAVSILIDVAKAVSYAHDRGVVHQDIKPDNILLGDFGEVLLLDWGSALTRGPDGLWQGGIYGTPLYMAPEQARQERVGPAADIYALGATLFHCLLGRVPCWSDDPDEFWRMRRAGEIQAPTPAERGRVPAPLLSIALTALAPQPERRYAGADAFLRDLQSYQAGQAVAAHRDSLLRFLGRWCRAHRHGLVAAAAVAASLALAALVAYRSWAREQASWRESFSEDFQRPIAAIAADWQLSQVTTYPSYLPLVPAPLSGASAWHPGSAGLACAPGLTIADLTCRRSFPGDVRIEWDEVSATAGLNLNCYLGSDRLHGYTFHLGGWGDSSLVVLTHGPELARLTWTHIPPIQPGRRYHLAMELADRSIRLEVDGQLALEYQGIGGMDAPDRPTFGFDAVVDEVEVSHVRVFTRTPPELVSPLAVADALYRAGDWQPAHDAYDALLSAYPDTAIAARALFGRGLALARAGRADAADADLKSFIDLHPRHEDVPFAIWERLRLASARHDGALEERLRQDLVRFRGHPVLSSVINELSEDACALEPQAKPRSVGDVMIPPGAIERVEAAGRALVRWSQAYGVPWASTRFGDGGLGWLQEAGCDRYVLELLSTRDDRNAMACSTRCRITLGEHRAILADPRTPANQIGHVRLEMLDPREIATRAAQKGASASMRDKLALSELRRRLAADGRAAVAPEVARRRAKQEAWAAQHLPQGEMPMTVSHYLDVLGRCDEVLAYHPEQFDDVGVIALERLQSGRQREGAELVRSVARMSWFIPGMSQDSDNAFAMCAAHDLLPAVLELDEGRPVDLAGLEAVVHDRCAQQMWYEVRFMRGEIDEAAFLGQPVQMNIDDRLALAKGLRSELAHDRSAALAAYRLILDPSTEPDVTGHIAAWRRMRLGDPQ